MKTKFLSLILLFVISNSALTKSSPNNRLTPYVNTLKQNGKEPVSFILEKLDSYDLLLFDDALHTAVEPFDFYQQLVRDPDFQKKVKFIFLEAVSVNQQPALDAYFESETNDISLLYPAFQNDFSGTGWPYKTYFDLLQQVWEVNASLQVQDRFQVKAVNAPVYWQEIHTAKNLGLFRLSLVGNDYTMYKIICSYLDNFEQVTMFANSQLCKKSAHSCINCSYNISYQNNPPS